MKSQRAGKTCTVCISGKAVWEMAGCRQMWFSKGKAGFLQAPHVEEFGVKQCGVRSVILSCQDVLSELLFWCFLSIPFFLDPGLNPSLKDDRAALIYWDFLVRIYRKFFLYFANIICSLFISMLAKYILRL